MQKPHLRAAEMVSSSAMAELPRPASNATSAAESTAAKRAMDAGAACCCTGVNLDPAVWARKALAPPSASWPCFNSSGPRHSQRHAAVADVGLRRGTRPRTRAAGRRGPTRRRQGRARASWSKSQQSGLSESAGRKFRLLQNNRVDHVGQPHLHVRRRPAHLQRARLCGRRPRARVQAPPRLP
ncbi:hypothetical protein M885DRAFT_141360 [Pelagophyceae sp. CCMP2097]|nr:hypothetical protein M885DRAFT_141360 [Pelagophyceae sp. CCMP2097]